MAASPTCVVATDGVTFVSTLNGVNVASAASITVQLANPAGVSSWVLTVVGTDEQSAVPAISVAGIGNSQRTFTMPASASAIRLQSVINSGVDGNNQPVAAYTTTFEVYVLPPGGVRLLATGETYEGNSIYGWIAVLNALLRLSALSLYGEIYTVAADSASFSLPSIGTPVNITFAHDGAAQQGTSLSTTKVTITSLGLASQPVFVKAEVAFTAPATPTDITFVLYHNGVAMPDSLRPTEYPANDLVTVSISALTLASVGDTFAVYAYTTGASGATTLAVSNGNLIVQNSGANQGPPGPVGPGGIGGGADGPPVSGTITLFPVTSPRLVDLTSVDSTAALPTVGLFDGLAFLFTLTCDTSTPHAFTLTSSSANIDSAITGPGLCSQIKVNQSGGSITVKWSSFKSRWVQQ